MKTLLNFREYLIEMFDKPWDLEDISDTTLGRNIDRSAKAQAKVDRVRSYKAEGDNGYIIEFAKNKAMEIHHLDSDFSGGYMNPSAARPNPRYISTMMHRAKTHLDSGFPVRVTGTEAMFHHYHRIGKMLARKHGYELSKPKSDTYQGHSVKSYVIQPKNSMKHITEAVGKSLD